jgi:hypothetical protein
MVPFLRVGETFYPKWGLVGIVFTNYLPVLCVWVLGWVLLYP